MKKHNLLKCQIVMLPTEKASKLYYNNPTETLCYDDKCTGIKGANEYRHLYFVSDREIKEGDWFTTSVDSSKYHHNIPIYQCKSRPKDKDQNFNWVNSGEFTFKPENCKKIEATTNNSLVTNRKSETKFIYQDLKIKTKTLIGLIVESLHLSLKIVRK